MQSLSGENQAHVRTGLRYGLVVVLFASSGPLFLAFALANNWLSFTPGLPSGSLLLYAGAFLSIAIVSGLAVVFFSRRASAMRQLVDVSERISHGDLEARARVNRLGEVGELALAVNHMADELVGALRDVERERTAVISAVIEAVVEIDKNGRILAANPATEKLFGWRENELIDRNLRLILPSTDFDRGHPVGPAPCANQRGMEFPEGCEFDGKHKDGRRFPVNMSLARRSFHGKPRFVGVITDLSEQRAYIRKLEEIAFYDPLTKIPARRLILDRLDTALRRAQRNDTRFAVLFIDLNRFKPINDQYGHAVGDSVLAILAQRLLDATRDSDTVGRIGGDEFVVVAEDITNVADTWILVDRYESVISKPIPVEGHKLQVHASIGTASFPGDAQTASELLEIADGRMYANKPHLEQPVLERRH